MDDSILYMFGGTDIYGEKTDLWEFSIIQSRWKYTKTFKEVNGRTASSKYYGIYKDLQVIVVIGGKNVMVQFYDLNM